MEVAAKGCELRLAGFWRGPCATPGMKNCMGHAKNSSDYRVKRETPEGP